MAIQASGSDTALTISASGSGNGVSVTAAGDSANAVLLAATGSAATALYVLVTGDDSSGVVVQGGNPGGGVIVTGEKAVEIVGYGSGAGLRIAGGPTGHGIDVAGGASGGDALHCAAPNGSDISGDVAGNLAGDVTGSVLGSAGNVTKLAGTTLGNKVGPNFNTLFQNAGADSAKTLDDLSTFDSATDDIAGSVGAVVAAVNLPEAANRYEAEVQLVRNTATTVDEYTVAFLKNGVRVVLDEQTHHPRIEVFRRSNGSVLIAETELVVIASCGLAKHNESTNRLPPGETAIALVRATIDGQVREDVRLASRDL